MTIVLWVEFRIWTVSEVYTINISGDLPINDIDHLIGVLMVNWCEVTLEHWVLAWLNVKFAVEVSFDRRKQQP